MIGAALAYRITGGATIDVDDGTSTLRWPAGTLGSRHLSGTDNRGVPLTIGVLALQGDVREHLAAVTELGHTPLAVRRPAEVDAIDALILPGGESTTMCRLLDIFGLRAPLQRRLADGLPAFGSCAGMILLADRILDGRPDQEPLHALDITVRRNAFGRQVDSFEGDVLLTGMDEPVPGVFIRAPWVEEVGPEIEVLASVAGHPVAVRCGSVLATSFHPEISGDLRVHRYFLDLVPDRSPVD